MSGSPGLTTQPAFAATPGAPNTINMIGGSDAQGDFAPAYTPVDPNGAPIAVALDTSVQELVTAAGITNDALTAIEGSTAASATAAAQTTGNTTLASILSGQATATNQATIITDLGNILTKLGSVVLGVGAAVIGSVTQSGSWFFFPGKMTPIAGTASAIVTGGTPVTLVTGPCNGGWVTNPTNAAAQGIATAENANVDPVAAPASGDANGNGTTTVLLPGQTFEIPALASGQLIRANAATSGHKFTVVVL